MNSSNIAIASPPIRADRTSAPFRLSISRQRFARSRVVFHDEHADAS